MNQERKQIEDILGKLKGEQILILREILQAEKNYLHRKNLQGTNIVNHITDIIKERIK